MSTGDRAPRRCDEIRNGFILAAKNANIFRTYQGEYGHYPRILNLHLITSHCSSSLDVLDISLVMHTTPLGVPVYDHNVFFNPSRAFNDKAPWGYMK
jgi:hypothetical protein